MALQKTAQRRNLIGARSPSRREKAGSDRWPVYSTSALHPGKLIKRLPDGSEVVGTFQDGTFVPE